MIRAVLDTNVLVSALIRHGGIPAQLLAAQRTGLIELVTSEALLAELQAVLARPRISELVGWSIDERTEFVDRLAAEATIVAPIAQLSVVERDPADNRVLEAAVAGQSDFVVSGDKDLLSLSQYEGIPIVTPARMLAVLHELAEGSP